MRFLKFSAASIAAFTMAMAPVAQGEEARNIASVNAKPRVQTFEPNYNVDKAGIQEFLKYTGLNTKKRMTVGEFHAKMRPFYPASLRAHMDTWAAMNRNEYMPEFQASTYKDGEGKERVRLILTKDGQTFTASYNPDSNGKYLKVNNVFLTKDDVKFYDQAISKLYYGDKNVKETIRKTKPKNMLSQSIVLGYDEYSRLTARQRAEYMVKVRYALENAERVMTSFYGPQAVNEVQKKYFVQLMLLDEAFAAQPSKSIRAAKPGDPCIVSGYLASYGNDYSCGGTGPGRAKLIEQMNTWGGGRCTNGTVSCNPLVYGYGAGGSAICVKNAGRNSEIYNSTSQACPNASPLRKGTADEQADKKRIIESYLAANDPETLKKLGVDGLTFKDGKVPKDQYDLIAKQLGDLNKYIDDATTACKTVPLSDITKVRDEQQKACTALALRKIDLEHYPDTVVPVPIPPAPPVVDCSTGDNPRGSELVDGKCTCRKGESQGTISEDGKDVPACMPPVAAVGGDEGKVQCTKDQKPNPEAKDGDDQCKAAGCTWCKWLIGGLIFAGVGAAVYFLTRGHGKDSNTTTSADPCPPAPLICMPTTSPTPVPSVTPPPIQPPPTTPTTPTDPIPTPAVTPFVESTSGTSTSTSSGVR